jgi:hypothetical protein
VDAVHFDVTSAFDIELHTLFLQKFSAVGFSGGYVNWFWLLPIQQIISGTYFAAF